MTGGLGQRSGSTGSLQWLQIQQQHQLQQQLNPAISSFNPPINVRKVNKSGGSPSARDKLGFWICRIVGRKRAGMSLLFLVSLLVFISFLFSPNKGEDGLRSEVTRIQSSRFSERPIVDRFDKHHTVSNYTAQPELASKIKNNESVVVRMMYQNQSRIHPPVASADPSLPPGHVCQHFTLPPPPADKKRTGPRPCPVCYLPVEEAAKLMPAIPSATPVKKLTYVTEVASAVPTQGSSGSDFGGYPTLKQRDDYFNVQVSMHVHCGFVKGSTPGNATGFDFEREDIIDMNHCHGIVVASAVFGNYDEIQQPENISEISKREVCFFMFVDETTESFLRQTAALDNSKMIGLWRIVVVHNLPYSDGRRTGKIPKLLLHRIFPNVNYSLWIDGKLRLVADPIQILERFLWRTNATFAISQHYKRFDVFDEAEANKAAGKYNNASIDAQVEFYRKEGLTPYSSSKLPITSDVPEGCVIIREHNPLTNLFSCLWFNEVDRFTPRDQLSFAIVRDKLTVKVNGGVKMFHDCERRNFVVQAYHREVLEKRIARMMTPALPKVEPSRMSLDEPSRKSSDDKVPQKVLEKALKSSGRKGTSRHGRDKRSANARHRKAKIGSKVAEFS